VQDILGRTPLLLAVSLDMPSAETVATLIALGADLNTPDALGATPMRVAVDRGRTQLVAMLAAAGAPVPSGVPMGIGKHHKPVAEPIAVLHQHAFPVCAISKGHIRALELALKTGKHSVDNLTCHASAYGTIDRVSLTEAGASTPVSVILLTPCTAAQQPSTSPAARRRTATSTCGFSWRLAPT
jgi:hypothetical protein